MNATSRYARTQTQTASKERLMVMLFERALQDIRVGALALEGNKPREAFKPLTHASDIVLHLSATLNRKAAPALTDNLAAVYQFVATRLTRAALSKSAALAREAERAFAPLVEAFSVAVAQASQGSAR